MNSDVFISYSTRDTQAAERTRQILTANSISCWMAPESIPAGSDYGKEIDDAIKGSRLLLLILSGNSQASEWVIKEVTYALSCGKTVIPFHIDSSDLVKPFSFQLNNVQRIEAYQDVAKSYEELVAFLHHTLEGKDDAGVKIPGESRSLAETAAEAKMGMAGAFSSAVHVSGPVHVNPAATAAPEQKKGVMDKLSELLHIKSAKGSAPFVKLLAMDMEAFKDRVPAGEAKRALGKLSEDLRYSDPVSSDATAPYEQQLLEAADRIAEAVGRMDTAATAQLCREASAILKDRNRVCRAHK